MIALLLAGSFLALPTLSIRVERSRDTLPPASIRVSTSLDTNGGGVGRSTPIDAERAFAADAKNLGQWTAFRKWAAADATMFVPQPVDAQDWLKNKKDPAKAIDWWPTASYVSCDGNVAVNTGGWKRPDGKVGYFSTVWRQVDGSWKWIVDGGGDLTASRKRPLNPKIRAAKCESTPFSANAFSVANPNGVVGQGHAVDGSLYWYWVVAPDGSRTFGVLINRGSKLVTVLQDNIPVEPK